MKFALMVGLLVVLTACDRTSGMVQLRHCDAAVRSGFAWRTDSIASSVGMDTVVVRFVCPHPTAEK